MSKKFSSKRDELLWIMSVEGWANESSGNTESPSNWFARFNIYQNELSEIRSAFDAEGFKEVTDSDLVGNFLVVEDSQGFVYVTKYDTQIQCREAFLELDREYGRWLDENEN